MVLEVAMRWWHKLKQVTGNVRMWMIVVEELVNACERISNRIDGLGDSGGIGSKKEGNG